MPIYTEECPHDMNRWVAEKADSVLSEACKIVDWFREMSLELSESDRDRIVQALYRLIFDAAKLSSFGNENMDCWSGEWVELMFAQGYDRFLEFQQRASRKFPMIPRLHNGRYQFKGCLTCLLKPRVS